MFLILTFFVYSLMTFVNASGSVCFVNPSGSVSNLEYISYRKFFRDNTKVLSQLTNIKGVVGENGVVN